MWSGPVYFMALGLWLCTVFPFQGAVSMAVCVQSLDDEAQEQSGVDAGQRAESGRFWSWKTSVSLHSESFSSGKKPPCDSSEVFTDLACVPVLECIQNIFFCFYLSLLKYSGEFHSLDWSGSTLLKSLPGQWDGQRPAWLTNDGTAGLKRRNQERGEEETRKRKRRIERER